MTDPRDVTPGDWRRRESSRRGVDTGTVVWGLILIVVGGWFFLDQTLGLDMPKVDWESLWPVVLIVIGAAVILQGIGRRRA
jgi:hypothetical protein